MNDRIRIYNITNHLHSVAVLNPNGGITARALQSGKFMYINEEQFLHLYNSTRDITGGYIGFDKKDIDDEVLGYLGLTRDEVESDLKLYTEEEVEAFFKGKVGQLDKFLAEVEAMKDDDNTSELKNRVFNIAMEHQENLAYKRIEKIEEITGKNFKVNNEVNEEENK